MFPVYFEYIGTVSFGLFEEICQYFIDDLCNIIRLKKSEQ